MKTAPCTHRTHLLLRQDRIFLKSVRGFRIYIDLSLRDTDNRSVGVGVHPKPPYWADDSYWGSLKA